MDRVDHLAAAGDTLHHTTPAKQSSGGIPRQRRQSELKPLMEVEVCGAVFESATIHRVFFTERPELIQSIVSYNHSEVKKLLSALRSCVFEAEAYDPLVALFTFIIAQPLNKSKGSHAHQARKGPPSFFMVYTKEMKTKVDGAGRLKPDVLNTKKRYGGDQAVPWTAVRIAIEVKSIWREGFQQALTYARSMLEVGDKWYALVLVYNYTTSQICFCFATRSGVFVSPPWSLRNAEGYAIVADALLHACYAPESESGLDVNRCLDAEGTRFLHIPTVQPWIRLDTELFASIEVYGRATHAYVGQPDATFSKPAQAPDRDPKGFSSKMEKQRMVHLPSLNAAGQSDPVARVGTRSRTAQAATTFDISQLPPVQPFSPSPAASSASAPALMNRGTSQAAPALPGARIFSSSTAPPTADTGAAASSDDVAMWEALCVTGESLWATDALNQRFMKFPSVAKEAWVVHGRRDIEIVILQAVKGHWAFVEYLGHTVIAHPGMERLSVFISPPGEGEASRICSSWQETTPSGQEPLLQPRDHRVIFYTPEGRDLVTICDKPVRVAHAMKDVATALGTLHKKGFIHRDVSPWNFMAHELALKNAAGLQYLPDLFGNRWRDFEHLFLEQHIFVIDFDHAVCWMKERELLPERSATWAFMAAARIKAWINKAPWIDTLIDDLESALWSLFYATLKANFERLSKIEQLHYKSFESDNPYLLAATKHMFLSFRKDEVKELSALKASWPLWWRLVEVARRSRDEVTAVKDLLGSNETFATTTEENRTRLNEVCQKAVVGYIQAVKEALTEMALAENEL